MFQSLSEKLENAFRKFKSKGKLTESDVKAGMREIKLALLEADVNFKVVKDFVNSVSARAVGSEVLESLLPAQQIVKIVNEELTALMGGTQSKLTISSKPPTVVMMVGLQGAGKTTHAGKLAGMYKKQGKHPLLVACDVYRPAAIKQLEIVGEKLGIPVFTLGDKESPVKIAEEGLKYAKQKGYDMVFIDTAGRLHIDEALMQELQNIKSKVEPTEILLTVDAMIGQDAVNVAKTFDELLDVTGVILTKLDGDTRGGAALSIRQVTLLSPSTPTEWRREFSAWATCSLLLKRLSRLTTRKRRWSLRKRSESRPLLLTTILISSLSLRVWEVLSLSRL